MNLIPKKKVQNRIIQGIPNLRMKILIWMQISLYRQNQYFHSQVRDSLYYSLPDSLLWIQVHPGLPLSAWNFVPLPICLCPLLYGCPARHSVRPLPSGVHENHCRIVEYHCYEEKEYYLSVLHGCCNMMLDERTELSSGSGRICSPSLIPRLSRRSLRSVVPV